MQHLDIVAPTPSSSQSVRIRQRRQGFNCPPQDDEGKPLSGQGSSANASSGPNGSFSQNIFSCTYDGGAGECAYLVDGTLSTGSGLCPVANANIASQRSSTASTALPSSSTTPPPTPPSSLPPSSSASPTSNSNINLASSTTLFPSSAQLVGSTFFPSSSDSSIAAPTTSSLGAKAQLRTLSPGSIGGITVGAVACLLLGILILLCLNTRRRRRQVEPDEPEETAHPFSANTTAGSSSQGTPWRLGLSMSDKSSTVLTPSSSSRDQQEYLAAQLREVHKQLEAAQAEGSGTANLEQAMQQNEALRIRIRTLERELQGYLGGEAIDHSPPGYLD
ncbi:hypothetical protein FB45DRAFT_1030456 [Roridomyces roridus]|uniref:Uncharacterized protein n=1 Tax=Roridomyces roridus TaxID=1738132 RepID=A0AAD7BPD4_9AGAR|nr:hypothetical protein FB45DRAFT_1030456 [Roridomyces roridus]